MADQTIFDLGQETAMTAAHRLVVQDTGASTTAQSATFALVGGLEPDAQTPSGNITGAVGKLYVITTTSMVADIDVTVPSANPGERMGVYCNTDEPDYEIVIKGAASQTINGGSAATEWSRLFINGECVILLCVAANTWIVEKDGRIAQHSQLEAAGTQTLTTGVWTDIDFNAGEDNFDVGLIFDDTINSNFGGFVVRRDSKYKMEAYCVGTPDDTKALGMSLKVNGTQEAAFYRHQTRGSSTSILRYTTTFTRSFSQADTIGLVGFIDSSSLDVQCMFTTAEIL